MAGPVIALKPGETLTIVSINPDVYPSHPIMLPGMPGWGQRPPYPDQGLPGNQPYPDQGLPGNQPYPDQGLPGSQPRPDHGLPPFPNHPIVIPPTEPPPVQPPTDSDEGNWVWAWSPQAGRWVWVKVPGEGEAGPKEA